MLLHLTAHTQRSSISLLNPAVAPTLWRSLRSAFPEALAAVLMATPLHLLAEWSAARAAQQRLQHVLSGCARRRLPIRGGVAWESVPLPDEIPDSHHLARQVRYVVLNPSRDDKVDDPLRWYWSTHRDVMGAVAEPWISADRLAAALRQSTKGFTSAHHRYVSGDPSVSVVGTDPPVPAARRTSPAESLERIAWATSCALRVEPAAVKRRGEPRRFMVQLAHARGWRDVRTLADACSMERTAVYRLLASPLLPSLSAGLLCLGDHRLLDYAPRGCLWMPPG